jgi:hypothetical protein
MSGTSTPPSNGWARTGWTRLSGQAHPPPSVKLLQAGALAAVAAVVVNLAIWGLGRAAGVDFEVTQPDGSQVVVGAGAVISQSLTATLAGTLLLWPLTRLPAGLLVWTLLAAFAGLGSLVFPLSRANHGSTALTLALMHLVALAAVLALPARVAYRAPGEP